MKQKIKDWIFISVIAVLVAIIAMYFIDASITYKNDELYQKAYDEGYGIGSLTVVNTILQTVVEKNSVTFTLPDVNYTLYNAVFIESYCKAVSEQ